MKVRGLLLLLYLLAISISCIQSEQDKSDPRFVLFFKDDTSSPTKVYIPRDLSECHAQLDGMLHNDIKKFFAGEKGHLSTEDAQMFNYYFGPLYFGQVLRDKWGLSNGSRLSRYFNGIGLNHPADMLAIIFDSYQAKLRGQEYDAVATIERYKEVGARKNLPPEFIDPESGGRVMTAWTKQDYLIGGESPILIGINDKTGETWYFEAAKGWYKPSPDEREAQNNTSWMEVLPNRNGSEN